MPELKWNKYTKRNRPKKEGDYLIACGHFYSIASYAKDLSRVHKYDFEGVRRRGFYGYNSEFGYYEYTNVDFWSEIPEPCEEGENYD